MDPFNYTLPGFNGYSAVRNRRDTIASDIQNFETREISLRVRGGSLAKIPATSVAPESFFMLKTKSGVKHFLGVEGANLWKANAGLTAWNTPALKSDCSNAIFSTAVSLDKIYMGNGVDRLSYDGTTLTSLTAAPLFTAIATYKNQIWCNHLTEPTFIYRNEFDSGGVPQALSTSYYIQISEDNGDGIKGIFKLLTHLLVFNEFSLYAIYGSSSDDFTKVFIGPVGAVNNRSIADVNENIYWLSQDGIYSHSGGEILPVSFSSLGRLEDIVNMSRLSNSCAVGYKNYYWLAISSTGSSSNDIVLIYDTIEQRWNKFKFPFSINDFCLDGNNLYCAAGDKKIYQLDVGSLDDATAITSNWVSDPLDFNRSGRKKKLKAIAIEIGNVAAGGTLNVYVKEDNGDYSSAYPYTIPTASPGKTAVVRVRTGKFYNLTLKLETTAAVTIDKISFGGKVARKVK